MVPRCFVERMSFRDIRVVGEVECLPSMRKVLAARRLKFSRQICLANSFFR